MFFTVLGDFCNPKKQLAALGELWEALGELWGALTELWEALGELWEGLEELWEALGELWEGLEELGAQYLSKKVKNWLTNSLIGPRSTIFS